MRRRALALAVALGLAATPAAAQEPPPPPPPQQPAEAIRPDPAAARAEAELAAFVADAARLWAAGDAAAIAALLAAEGGVLLDPGVDAPSTQQRHAAAALRALFAAHESLTARVAATALAATDPPRGFGELVWTFRVRGAPGEQTRSVYVATRREGGDWRITELRLLH